MAARAALILCSAALACGAGGTGRGGPAVLLALRGGGGAAPPAAPTGCVAAPGATDCTAPDQPQQRRDL